MADMGSFDAKYQDRHDCLNYCNGMRHLVRLLHRYMHLVQRLCRALILVFLD